MPIRRAIQRDEEAIRRWRDEVWPELLRRARSERRVLVFEDESGFYLLPGVVRTYAPEAQTPVIREKQTRDHLSVMGGMTPAGQGLHPGPAGVAQRAAHASSSSMHLRARGRGAAAGDLGRLADPPPGGGQGVRGRAHAGKVRVEALPGYAPDLNPWDEGGWHHLKNVRDAQPGVPRPGGVARAVPPRRRSPPAEASPGPILLRPGRLEPRAKLNPFMRRSVR